MNLSKALVCEFLGTAFLVATVVGSGILAHRLDQGNVAISVMAVAVATGCVLFAIISAFGAISCQLNPVVTMANAWTGVVPRRHVVPLITTQILGGIAGTIAANLMFELPALAMSTTARTGSGQWLGEFIATFGLLGVILGCARCNPKSIAAAVACYVCGAIWFTSSTCFANPAVTIARVFTDSLTGIRLADIAPFILCEVAGAAAAVSLFGWLFKDITAEQNDSVEQVVIQKLEALLKR